jgi:hypothetical protein
MPDPESTRPMLRAALARLSLRRIASEHPTKAERIRAHVGQALCDAVDEAGPLGWVPYSFDVALTKGLLEELGESGAEAFIGGMTEVALTQPLFRPIVEGSLRLFGPSHGLVVRLGHQIWPLVCRNVVDLRVERLADSTVVMGERACDELLQHTSAQFLLRVQCASLFRLSGVKARSAMLAVNRPARRVVVTVVG